MEAEPTSSSAATSTAASTHKKKTRSSHHSQQKRQRRRSPPEQTSSNPAHAAEILALEPEEPSLSDFTPRRQACRQDALIADVQRRSVFSSNPIFESPSKAGPSQRAFPHLGCSASSTELTDSNVEEALANLRKASRGSSRKSTGSARKPGHSRSKRDRSSPSLASSASHFSAADPDVDLLEEKKEEEEEELFPQTWEDMPMSVAIHGRRQAIAKITGTKCPAQPYHAKQLAGRVIGIYTATEHSASDFFGRDFAKV